MTSSKFTSDIKSVSEDFADLTKMLSEQEAVDQPLMDGSTTELQVEEQQENGENGEEKAQSVHEEELTSQDPTAQVDNNEVLYENEKKLKRQCILDELLDQSKASKSYYTNSKKESLILTYVDNFKRQYTQLYPTSKPLLLDHPNQFGIKVSLIINYIRNSYVRQFVLRNCHTRNYMITRVALDLLQITSTMSH